LATSPSPHVLHFDVCGITQNLNMEWPTTLAMNCTVVGFVFLYRRLYILNLDFWRALIKNVVLQTREFSCTNLWRMSVPCFCCCVLWLGPTTQRSHWCHSHFLPPTTPDFAVLKGLKWIVWKLITFYFVLELKAAKPKMCQKLRVVLQPLRKSGIVWINLTF